MRRKLCKNLCSLFLTLTMILGLFPGMSLTAYAAPTEELLTTITAVGTSNAPTATSANVSYSTEDIATLTFSQITPYGYGGVSYVPTWGWWGYGITLTVTPADGYTITQCVFYDDKERTATDSEAPFVVETTEEDKTPQVNGAPILAYQSRGITKIEVYGYATPAHTHSFTYSASGATITATCGEGCDITEGLTLTISAPTGDLTADGTKTFPATLSTGYNTTAFPGTYTITYTKNGAEFTGTPTEAGEYTASVTVGTATASVSYTVNASKDTQTITATDVTATYGDTGVKINARTTGDGGLSYAVKSGDAVTVDSSGNLTIVKAGTAVITITATETATYAQATKDVTVNISKADIDADSIDVSIESWVAGEDTNTPVITGLPAGVSADNVIIMYAPEGSDQFTTDMPSTAGNYVVKVVVPESDNYKEATFTASLTIEPVVYSFIGDDGLSWIKGSSETLSFTAKRNVSDDKTFGKFTGILVDGVEVSANNYTAVSGSVVVTLSADYLNTLSVGEHTITIRFSDGADITTRFTVKASGIASPATGETISIWTLMGFACIAAAGAVISFKRWKKEEE